MLRDARPLYQLCHPASSSKLLICFNTGDHSTVEATTLPGLSGHDSPAPNAEDNLSPFARMAGQGPTTVSTTVVSPTVPATTVSGSFSVPTVESSTVFSPTVSSSTIAGSVSSSTTAAAGAATKHDEIRECVHPKDLSCIKKLKDDIHYPSNLNPLGDIFR